MHGQPVEWRVLDGCRDPISGKHTTHARLMHVHITPILMRLQRYSKSAGLVLASKAPRHLAVASSCSLVEHLRPLRRRKRLSDSCARRITAHLLLHTHNEFLRTVVHPATPVREWQMQRDRSKTCRSQTLHWLRTRARRRAAAASLALLCVSLSVCQAHKFSTALMLEIRTS